MGLNFSRCLITAGAILAVATAQANSYTIVDLGQDHFVYQIANDGQIAGTNFRYEKDSPLAWRNGHWHRLYSRGYALATDEAGNTGGTYGNPSIWTRDDRLILLGLPAGSDEGFVYSMSNGLAVGDYYEADGSQGCFIGSVAGGQVTDLGWLGSNNIYCEAHGINPSSQVVGGSMLDDFNEHAFMWHEGQMEDLGVDAGDVGSVALGINQAGTVVGLSRNSDGAAHAVAWENGSIVELGVAERYVSTGAQSINNLGEIVGYGRIPKGQLPRAVRFFDGVVIDLDTEVSNIGDWKLFFANSINDSGVIVGWGRREGKEHGFMLVPQGNH